MTVSDVTARIAEIQARLSQLSPAPARSGTSFAAVLDGSLRTARDTAGTTGADDSGGGAVVAEARKYLGVPYVWGGTDPSKGLDCSGLIQVVFEHLGYDVPRVSWQQAQAGTEVTGGLAAARPGDILAFGSPVHHVGIYIGDGKMIEAPRPGKDVRVSDVYETPTHIRRILPDSSFGVASSARVAPAIATGNPGARPYAGLFAAAEQKYGVPATLLAAVAEQESGFDPSAVSPAGARGLMQLMPGTARSLGVDPLDPAQAVDGAARMLRDLTRRFGSTELALAAYNAGPGAVLKYDGIPPYPETQSYVRNVMSMMKAA